MSAAVVSPSATFLLFWDLAGSPCLLRSIIICHSFMICFFLHSSLPPAVPPLCYEALQPSVTLDPYKACDQPVSYFFSHRFRFET